MRCGLSTIALLALLLGLPASADAYTCATVEYGDSRPHTLAHEALEAGNFHALEGGRLLLWFGSELGNSALPDGWQRSNLEMRVTEDRALGEPLSLLRGSVASHWVTGMSAPSPWYAVALWTPDEEIGAETEHLVGVVRGGSDSTVVRFDGVLTELDESAVEAWISRAVMDVSMEEVDAVYEKECCIIRQSRPCAPPRRDVVEETCRGRVMGALPRVRVMLPNDLPATLPPIVVRIEVPFEESGFQARRGTAVQPPDAWGERGPVRTNIAGPGDEVSQPISVERSEVCLQALRLPIPEEGEEIGEGSALEEVGEPFCMALEVPAPDFEWVIHERRGGDACEGVDLSRLDWDWYDPRVARETNCRDNGTGLCDLLPEEPAWPSIPEEDFSSDSDSSGSETTGSVSEDSAGSETSTGASGEEPEGSSGCVQSGGPVGGTLLGFLLLGVVMLRRRSDLQVDARIA